MVPQARLRIAVGRLGGGCRRDEYSGAGHEKPSVTGNPVTSQYFFRGRREGGTSIVLSTVIFISMPPQDTVPPLTIECSISRIFGHLGTDQLHRLLHPFEFPAPSLGVAGGIFGAFKGHRA